MIATENSFSPAWGEGKELDVDLFLPPAVAANRRCCPCNRRGPPAPQPRLPLQTSRTVAHQASGGLFALT